MSGQNDHLFLSHYHDPEDGLANIEEVSEWIEDDRASLSSVVHRSMARGSRKDPFFSIEVSMFYPQCFALWLTGVVGSPSTQQYESF